MPTRPRRGVPVGSGSVWIALAALLLVSAVASRGSAQTFRSDDPLLVDHDDLPIPQPDRRDVSDWADALENLFAPPGDRELPRALNINTLGEVPDSSWYTNRIGVRPLSREEILRGPAAADGPGAPAPGTWTVVAAKSQGVTPGFRIEDPRGIVYVIKFDPPKNPEMATAAEVISTKLFHALGYHVPENYLVRFRREDLVIGATAQVTNFVGKKLPMTETQLDLLLTRVAKSPDGSMRALASRFLPGKPVGPFQFHGTRSDDSNDIFPHEHRRELRGYGVLCSWLNHDDSRSINTLDMYDGAPGEGHVIHYLIDFGSTLGSGSVRVQSRRAGNEYILEWLPVLKTLASAGLWRRPYIGVDYSERPSVGRFESAFFTPESWRPEYPNVAFDHMDLEDAWWAARLVMRFADDDLRAVVAAGGYSDPLAAHQVAEDLIVRRDKIGRHWLSQLSPLSGFVLEEGRLLRWTDLLVQYGFAGATPPIHVSLHRFDNATGARERITDPTLAAADGYLLPKLETSGDHLIVVAIERAGQVVDVYLRDGAVVGIDRLAPRRPALPHSKVEGKP